MFSKQLCIVNIRCYKIEQLKLHGSLLDMKGGGGQKQPSFQHLTVTLKCNSFFTKFLLKIRQTQQTHLKNVHKNNILPISFLKLRGGGGGGAENNPVGSSISDQCYFNVKYD